VQADTPRANRCSTGALEASTRSAHTRFAGSGTGAALGTGIDDRQNAPMRAVFVDANPALAALARAHPAEPGLAIGYGDPDLRPEAMPAALGGAAIAVIDHTALPTEVARRCDGLRHVVFLGTGARSYMDPEALAALGIAVHLIRGYGDTAVAECTIALLWAAAKGLAGMDRAMRAGRWLRTEGVQLTGKTLGLIGFGGIAAEVARLAQGIGMTVLAWNRTPKQHAGVRFVALEELLARSDAVSLHLLLTDETRGFLSAARLAALRPGALLVNTARGALVDEAAMVEALRSGQLAHAGLDVFEIEPLPPGHVLTTLPNVTLSAHSAFRTPEASANLIDAAFDHCRRIVAGGRAGPPA
jgi:D-3-phosphoglycerate dehydrogenase